MAGRKVFTSGEILTAADVNSFLMNQVVAVFADSTARSSAIPTPSEGMVTFREDQDVVEVYDGSAFKTVGGLVAVKSAINTGPEVFGSVASGGNVAVPDLSITHEVSDPANKLIITVSVGVVAGSSARASVGVGVAEDGTFIAVGDAASSRTRVFAGSRMPTGNNDTSFSHSFTFSHTPGSGSKTYAVEVFNLNNVSQTIYVNRNEVDNDASGIPRAASSIVIQEVAV